jgi:glycosyltransferase involved in cell wall biosynthesis
VIGVNGAFLAAPVTGVQRFAFQLLLGLLEARPEVPVRVYVPPLVSLKHSESKQPLLNQLRGAGAEVVMGPSWTRNKQVFEQLGLPLLARRDRVACLLHLNNNVSLLRRSPQVCFIYDLAPLRLPDTYRRAYRLKFQATIAGLRRRRPTVLTLSEFSRDELESVGVRVAAVIRGAVGSPMLLEASSSGPDSPGIEGDYAVVLGSADPRKRVEEVIAAWPPVFAALGLQLAVVQGVAPTHRAAEDAASAEPGVIRLRGRISDADLVRLMRGAKLAIFASSYEGGALAAEEVLALGTPVVASNIPTFRELLEPPVAFFDDLSQLSERCTQVLAAARPKAQTLEQVRDAWRTAGAALAAIVTRTSAEPAQRGRTGNSDG